MATVADKPPLAYPLSESIYVYKDDGRWDDYHSWYMRPISQMKDLYVCTIKLRTAKIDQDDEHEDEEVDLTIEEWHKLSSELVSDYPEHIFIYTAVAD